MLDAYGEYVATDAEIEDEYQEWLMRQPELRIGNGKDLVQHFEAKTMWEAFLAERAP